MNKTISLSAIAMFAVIMGMSAVAPAAMAAPNGNAQATIELCHYDSSDTELWEVIFVHSAGQLKGHTERHTDGQYADRVIDTVFDATDCTDRNFNGV